MSAKKKNIGHDRELKILFIFNVSRLIDRETLMKLIRVENLCNENNNNKNQQMFRHEKYKISN